ncbi:acetyl/propionyl/methylcrotonyl-CoA carboxylase subunit alpha [Ningiella sp. W23]|uniref:acetyl/propionyl/methylcrotonyl-CoA carboxylase subunit alpha n=1 Tax=Ningiella sp. W23 TaxID=3023715 RepID=UPI0037567789
MINKILIANRGEIACRIIRTAKRLGIFTVAVYSEADATSQHVLLADEAVLLGPAPASESYLNSELILKLAAKLNVDAIHPGYGFLSENADFSKACQQAGIVFIGPSPEAISAMGSKSAAKAIMEKADVPLVPGYHGNNQSPEFLKAQADDMGYPVLLKAAAGGGGKGMRQVWKSEDFHSALDAAKRESKASFGDEHMLIEKYLTEPRHVEIQVFCDNHGNGVYLFERDCSVQRRHQKIIEEAPAPNMPQDVRRQMGGAALKAAEAIHYSGAGTVEFLYDSDGRFYFMEMNTRLQVEHPVTEMITGEDLVAWQIDVANNLPLPKTQDELKIKGHAFEARIYAEDPDNEFLPQTGVLHHLRPPKGHGIRVDTGVEQGDEVSVYYDPMIAKLIVHANTREQALAKLVHALHQYQIVGVSTNIDYLLRVASSKAFKQANLTTDFVERHDTALKKLKAALSRQSQAIAAFASLEFSSHRQTHHQQLRDFRVNHQKTKRVQFVNPAQVDTVIQPEAASSKEGDSVKGSYDIAAISRNSNTWSFDIDGHSILVKALKSQLDASEQSLELNLQVDLNQVSVRVIRQTTSQSDTLVFFLHDEQFSIELPRKDFDNDDQAHGMGEILAPMNGTVVSILVKVGDSVKKGDEIAIVEAMKMEHALKAPFDAKVLECFSSDGERVDGGAALMQLEALSEE